jgi:hypothetical protein
MIVNMDLKGVPLKIYGHALGGAYVKEKVWSIYEITCGGIDTKDLLLGVPAYRRAITRALLAAAKEKACHDGELVI